MVATIVNRIAFKRNIAIEDARRIAEQFSRVDAEPGLQEVSVSSAIHFTSDMSATTVINGDLTLRPVLEDETLPGEDYFGLFRLALLSGSKPEAFMHLYNILLMLFNKGNYKENQKFVDNFIRDKQPWTVQTQTPRPNKPKIMETIYTRLRNELGHHRQGVDIKGTKAEMAKHLHGLIELTKAAIEEFS